VVAVSSQTCTIQDNTDYNAPGYLVMLYNVSSGDACCQACAGFAECTYWSYEKLASSGEWYKRCFIKNSGGDKVANNAIQAGNARPQPSPPTCGAIETGTDYDNGWLSLIEDVPDAATCCDACSYYTGCKYWSWTNNATAGAWNHRCYLKPTNSGKKSASGQTSGSSATRTKAAKRTGKRGLAWFNSRACSDLKLMTGVSWIYNWAPLPDVLMLPCLYELGINFLPMQWGGGGLQDLELEIYADSPYLLTFNEPNFKSQSNVSPKDAIAAWPQITAIAKKRNMKIGSPAAAACGPNPAVECYGGTWSPIPWFDDFFKGCANCQVDFLTTHIYTCNMTELTAFLEGLKKYNLPIWLTEFACPASGKPADFEMTFMKQALSYLDAQPWIEKYAWFGTRLDPTDGWLGPQVDLLAYDKCALTDLGKFYASK